jgi:protein pelota
VRLLHQDPSTGLLRLRLETPSDLWRISRLIAIGDRVAASTTRRDPEAPEETPGAQRERRRVWLTIRAEQVDFHGFSKHVRVTGPIVEGPFDIGRHHTLDLADGDELTVQKDRLDSADRALLEEGLAAKGDPRLLIACVDWGESTVVRLRGRAIENVADVNRTLAGKQYKGGQGDKDRGQYVIELVKVIVPEIEAASSVIVAGPGFLKEELAKRLIEADPAVKKKLTIVPTSGSGRVGIEELLRSGRASETLAQSVAAVEADLVEQLVTALGGGRRAAVGRDEVTEAVQGGAVETLLIGEESLRDPAVVTVLDQARAGRGKVLIVRGDGEAGRRLHGLGDIGAILRFDWASTRPRTSSARTH